MNYKTVIGVCEESMTISGTVTDWETWGNIKIHSSGDYIVNNALVPVRVDREKNIGRYIEPNVWVVHNVNGYPNSSSVYDSMGEAYEANKQYKLAEENFKKAYDLGKEQNHANTSVYLQNLNRVKNK